jgi:acyl-CoA thioester hydrolase
VSGADTATREGWAFAHRDRVRFGDIDALGHMNNVAFLRLFETARIVYLAEATRGALSLAGGQGFGMVFAECHIDYRAPAFFDEEVRTRVRSTDLRRSSFRLEFEMRCTADERLLAEGYGVMVGYDFAAGCASSLPDAVREALDMGEPAGG